MNIGRAFGFITEDEKWISKILIGGLILIVPILNVLALYGYLFETARNVAQGHPRPLPDWNNFGDKLVKGFYAFIISLVYAIPIIVIQVLVQGSMFVVAAGSRSRNVESMVGLVSLCLFPIMLVLGIATSVFIFAAFVQFIRTDNLGAAFRFKEIFTMIQKTPGTWLMLIVMYILAGIVGALGIIACGVGALFTGFFGMVAFGHALGQVAAQTDGTVRLTI